MADLAESTPQKPRRKKRLVCYALIGDDGAKSYYASNAEALTAACRAHLDSQFSIIRIGSGKAPPLSAR